MTAPLTVGILGAGQLARMMSMAASKVGAKCFVLADKESDCAIPVADGHLFNDKKPGTLLRFCENLDVLTIENEFIDLDWVKKEIGFLPFYPSLHCLGLVQDKLEQKHNLSRCKLACLDYLPVNSLADLKKAQSKFSDGLVLKTARFGYDGKGTFIFPSSAEFDPSRFWNDYLSRTQKNVIQKEFTLEFSGYVEPLAVYKKELAVVVARSTTGQTLCYPVIETFQAGGICRWAMAPAQIKPEVISAAQELAVNVIEGFGGVGVFGIEMFLLADDRVVINEIAPRVHNSGHLTMDGCEVGQFEMHLRAVAGMPLLGENLRWPGMAMVNIIGPRESAALEFSPEKREIVPPEGLWIHWYGKTGGALGRKLGHINACGNSPDEALKKATAFHQKWFQ